MGSRCSWPQATVQVQVPGHMTSWSKGDWLEWVFSSGPAVCMAGAPALWFWPSSDVAAEEQHPGVVSCLWFPHVCSSQDTDGSFKENVIHRAFSESE